MEPKLNVKILIALILVFSSTAWGETLTTGTYTIVIEVLCEEGNVTCDKVEFSMEVAGSDQNLKYTGNTMHSKCADGVTPCAFQGYEFAVDGATYILYNSGVLVVIDKKGNQVLSEQGTWTY